MHKESFASDKTLRETLSSLQNALPDRGVTLSMVLELLGKKSFLILATFLALPFLAPVSIPGTSTVFGAIILLIGMSLVFNRSPWLPERFMIHIFPTDKLRICISQSLIWIQRLEKISHRQMSFLCHGPLVGRVIGLAMVVASLLLMAPLAFIPFSNTLPALSILLLSIGVLQQDGIFIAVGHLFLGVASAYFTIIAFVGVNAFNMAVDMALK